MGVVNVTPDSFSDGGRYADLDAALQHGRRLVGDGATLIDVGGESTRPGADRIDADTETARVLPAIRTLAAEGIALSVDTTRAAVAAAALEAGVLLVNDVSGGLADPGMARVVADAGCPWVLMHWRGPSQSMQSLATYRDVVAEVRDELAARVDAALAAGVAADRIVLDPGLGFAKSAEHNWRLLAHLEDLVALGFPVLVGASRKSFLGRLLAAADGTPRPVPEREDATVATSLIAARAGAWGVRVHEVRPTVDALRVLDAVTTAAGADQPLPPAHPPDTISLTGLRVRGRHGVLEHEKTDGQDFVVDAVLETDTGPAARSDDLTWTVDYGQLARRLATAVSGEPVDLIETLAQRLVGVCLSDPRVRAAQITVHKPQAPIPLDFGDIAVTVRRTR
jgi:dihydropteroate synthase